ncbi:CoA transferase [Caballeronia sp. LZ065]|uniref:CoA transferase n=1 Tax=Caballeronia sp. LZ065 TaxID=3038571 RepID=UPI00285E6308|nr:CoA transferase [Caballeronia sp. LZ065]MDR5781099.1 CoA transferase [Caballeronia sp. LZ065]
MHTDDAPDKPLLPLAGCRVIERSRTAAAAYAGRMLAALGATVIMLEPPEGSRLRRATPTLPETGESALFAFLAAGKRSLVCDASTTDGQNLLERELDGAHIFLDDTPVSELVAQGTDSDAIRRRYPNLVHVSILPFGAFGPKAHWVGEEVNVVHAGGEGFLLPNGLSATLFPNRAPLKIYGHFASFQGGCSAAMCALSAWWSVPRAGGQFVDISVQDAALSVGAFALQRLGDGSLEHRGTRSFRYGGVFEAQDGFVELLTLEDRQWRNLVALMDHPDWAADPALDDPLERSRRGDEINVHIAQWTKLHNVEMIVSRAQSLGVPAAKYRTPEEVLTGEHERSRQLFSQATLESGVQVDVLVAPFQFRCTPLQHPMNVPAVGEYAREIVQ